jgi:hypothetical protein
LIRNTSVRKGKEHEHLASVLFEVSCAKEVSLGAAQRKSERYTSRQLWVAASVAIVYNKGSPQWLIIVFVDRDNFHCVKPLRYVS